MKPEVVADLPELLVHELDQPVDVIVLRCQCRIISE
jgi:hypothetical protein